MNAKVISILDKVDVISKQLQATRFQIKMPNGVMYSINDTSYLNIQDQLTGQDLIDFKTLIETRVLLMREAVSAN